MKIGYIYTRPLPSRDTDSQQLVSTIDALSRAGVEVDLLYPARRSDRRDLVAHEHAVRSFYGARGPFRLRPLMTLEPTRLEAERVTHALAAIGLHGRRYDLIHTRSRSALTAAVALGLPVVFETYRRLGHDSPAFAWLLARLARRSRFLGVVTHSRQAAASLAGAGIPEGKLAVIYNGYDPTQLQPALPKTEARAALGLDRTRPLVCYTGNVQPQKGLGAVLSMAAETPEVDYAIVGGKDHDLSRLQRDIVDRRLQNVHTPGWRPAAKLRPWLYAADALIIPPTAAPLQRSGRTVLPMKLFAYLGAGRPILAPSTPDVQEILVDGDNALLVPPDDTASSVGALRRLLDEDGLRRRLEAGAARTSAGLTWDARASAVGDRYSAWLGR